MTAAPRALVQRPGRRLHLATLVDGSWLTVCDRELPLDGTAAREHAWHDELTAEQAAGSCRRCLAPILVARLALEEGHPALIAEVRTLRTRVRSLADIARRYGDRILSAPTVAGERALAERRHEQRVDRRLARIGA